MSVIGKQPYVNYIIDACSTSQVSQIVSLMNDLGTPIDVALYGQDNLISTDNIGVNYVSLAMEQISAKIIKGILVYIDSDHCGFFGIATNSDTIEEFKIDPDNKTFLKIREYLTIEELRQVCGDALVDNDPSDDVTIGTTQTITGQKTFTQDVTIASSEEGEEPGLSVEGLAEFGGNVNVDGQVVLNSADDLVDTDGNPLIGSGLTDPTEEGQVLVANSDLEAEWADAAPLADNLTGVAISNDALYSSGPTGGLADISTGEESYLSEIKGYSIVWNQLLSSSNSHTCVSGHYYIYYSGSTFSLIGPSSTTTYSASSTYKLFDLTLMFGSNDKIPFSLSESTEYAINGTIPAQTYKAVYGFQRLFANVDLVNAEYNAGEIKNVQVTSLTETGQNLWNDDETNGVQLLAGYRYEIYLNISSSYQSIYVSRDGGSSWSNASLTRYQRSDGTYVWTYLPTCNCLVKSRLSSYPIVFIGFVHSGNYCLTAGTNTNSSVAKTTETIPEYVSYSYAISGVDGLNGVANDDGDIIYDTVDTTRVGYVEDLSALTWTESSGTYLATIDGIAASTTALLSDTYLNSEMSVDSDGVITITADSTPTGKLLYELATEVSTGEDTFTPIPLQDSDGNWIVNDMGSEYFDNTYCPVNQISLYYENLKDKLVNLDIPEIEPADYSYAATALNGLTIDGTTYRIPRSGSGSGYNLFNGIANYTSSMAIGGTANSNYALCIGFGSTASNSYSTAIGCYRSTASGASSTAIGTSSTASKSYSTAIGTSSTASGSYSTAIGASSTVSSTYSTAIGASSTVSGANSTAVGHGSAASGANSTAVGYATYNYVSNSVSFDGTIYQRTLQLYDAEHIFFRNEVVSSSYTDFSSYTSGHYLSEYINLSSLTLTDDGTGIYTSSETFTQGTGVSAIHLNLEIETESTHACLGLDLNFKNDVAEAFSAGRVLLGGSFYDVFAYINDSGAVVINLSTIYSLTLTGVIGKTHLLG